MASDEAGRHLGGPLLGGAADAAHGDTGCAARQGVKSDKSTALRLFGKACDLKLEVACRGYATLQNQGVR